jgi:UDP-GlcNAc:undecaprenyl-phosphate/decaprenyl-phosphate GlcNAc-1-phosphate transferase
MDRLSPLAIQAGGLLLGGFVAAVATVRLGIAVARRAGFVAQPNPIVENHKRPVPMGGGVAVVLLLLLVTALLALIGRVPARIPLGILPVFVVALVDDLRALPPTLKFLTQCLSVVVYLVLGPVKGWLVAPAALFMVTTQNAWNQIDIMDGLLGRVAMIGFLGLAACFGLAGDFTPQMLCCILAAGLMAGFLVWNRHPARVFLGDTGSVGMGTLFAIMVLEALPAAPRMVLPLLVTGGIPYFELGFLIVERPKRGIRFYRKSTDHFALRLLHHGHSVPAIVNSVAVIAVALALLSILATLQRNHNITLSLLAIVAIAAAAWAYLRLDPLKPWDGHSR